MHSHSPALPKAAPLPWFPELSCPSHPCTPKLPSPQHPQAVESTFALFSVCYRQQTKVQWNQFTCSRSPVTGLELNLSFPNPFFNWGAVPGLSAGPSQCVTCTLGRPDITSAPGVGTAVLPPVPSSATLCRSHIPQVPQQHIPGCSSTSPAQLDFTPLPLALPHPSTFGQAWCCRKGPARWPQVSGKAQQPREQRERGWDKSWD